MHHSQNLLLQLCLPEGVAEGRLTIILSLETVLFQLKSGMLLIIGSFQTRFSHPSVFSARLNNSSALFLFHLLPFGIWKLSLNLQWYLSAFVSTSFSGVSTAQNIYPGTTGDAKHLFISHFLAYSILWHNLRHYPKAFHVLLFLLNWGGTNAWSPKSIWT